MTTSRTARHVVARLTGSVAILLALSFVLFGVLAQLPGDPVDLLVTSNPSVTAADVARLKKLRGLDQPWPVQWWRWLVGHREPVPAPPAPPARLQGVLEMPADGAPLEIPVAEALAAGAAAPSRVVHEPGVYLEPRIVDDGHGQESVALDEVLVSPRLSLGPLADPFVDAQHLDESERELAGGAEVEQASPEELERAARTAGSPVPLVLDRGRSAPVFTAAADGAVAVDGAALAQGAFLAFSVERGPGRFDGNGRYTARFDGPGRTAIVFRVTSGDGAHTARGAFLVDHGAVLSDAWHRGALFALAGDREALGYSSAYKRPVADLLEGRVQNTLALMLPAFLLSLLVAVPAGALAARAGQRNSAGARLFASSSSALATVAVSVPAFWLGLMAIIVFAARLHWFPAGGVSDPGDGSLADRVRHAALPVAVLAFVYAGQWFRYVRAGVVDVLPADFIRTARAKGLGPRAVLVHALKNALVPLVTVVALAAPQMFAGALLTETVFSWPGVGRLQYDAVLNNDSYVAIVVFLVSAALVLAASFVADALYVVIDPRMRRKQ